MRIRGQREWMLCSGGGDFDTLAIIRMHPYTTYESLSNRVWGWAVMIK